MIYHGRSLNPVALWESLGVEFPPGADNGNPTFLSKTACPNPEHDTTKRHFQVNVRQPVVHCFADCGISGSYEHAVCVVLGLYAAREITTEQIRRSKTPRSPHEPSETRTAREKVGAAHKEARKVILKHTRTAVGKEIAATIEHNGTRKTVAADSPVATDKAKLDNGTFQFLPVQARDYLDSRGIDNASRGKWQLGWCEEEERLIVPAYDERDVFRFLIKRQIAGGGSLKYLYTPGTIKTSILFGACFVDRELVRSEGLVLVEGSLDVIRLHQVGVRNAVAILGTGLSRQQVRLVYRMGARRVYCLFDKDAAGAKNVMDARDKLTKLPLKVCLYPKGKSDPAELTKEEAERVMERALPMQAFLTKTRTMRAKELIA